jgi:chromosome partitioning protein
LSFQRIIQPLKLLKLMKVIAVSNHKGGVGKTVTAVSIAAALHVIHQQRVLLVDADPQGNATTHLLGDDVVIEEYLGTGIIDKDILPAIVSTPSGVDLVPADARLDVDEPVIERQKDWRLRLKQALTSAEEHYDYVIIDCPPALKTYTMMALVAADAYLVPTQPEKPSKDGLNRVIDFAEQMQQTLNPRLKLLGIAVTRYHKKLRNGHHDKMINLMREKYGEEMMLPTIRQDIQVLNAFDGATTIFNLAPTSNATQDYTALAAAVLERL